MRRLILSAILALPLASLADGPGTRIRTGPGITHPDTPPAAERDAERCYKLQEKEKERCLQRLRATLRGKERPPHAGPGPGSTGAGSGAGSGGTTAAPQ